MPKVPRKYRKHSLPPNARVWDYVVYPVRMIQAYAKRMTFVFGWRFLVFLCASQMFLKGAAYYLSASMMLPLLKNAFGVDAFHFQMYMMITMIPWSLKPLIGLLSDFFLVCGYHKRPWLMSGFVVGMMSCASLFMAYQRASALWTALCFCGVQYQVALFDLMSEAAYSAKMREHPYTGSDVITLTQGYQHVGGLVAMSFVGPMADHSLFHALFIITTCVCAMPVVPSLLGWLPEERFPHGVPEGNATTCMERANVHRVETPHADRWMVFVIAFTGIASLVSTLVSTFGDAGYGLVLALLLTAASLLGAYHVFPPLIFRVALYQVLVLVGAPSLRGAMDYFYTAGETCVPGGPHFSFAYYQTYAGLVGTACSLLGSFAYQMLLSGMRFRSVFILTSVLEGIVGLNDLFIVTRLNVKWGIPDKVAYIVGEAVMEPFFTTLNYIPAIALLSLACVEGMESSTFAFLAGINNFAYMISRLSGAFLFKTAGVRTSEPCNFDALPLLLLVCHSILPLVVGVGFAFLIPSTHQDEQLDSNGVPVIVQQVEEFDMLGSEEEDDEDNILGSADSEMELL